MCNLEELLKEQVNYNHSCFSETALMLNLYQLQNSLLNEIFLQIDLLLT